MRRVTLLAAGIGVAVPAVVGFLLLRDRDDLPRADCRIGVFFKQGASSARVKAVGDRLRGIDRASVRFVSKGQALNEMRRHYPELTAGMFTNPLPASFRVRTTYRDSCRALRRALRPRPDSVENVVVSVRPFRKA